jgi:hypothetical protein
MTGEKTDALAEKQLPVPHKLNQIKQMNLLT